MFGNNIEVLPEKGGGGMGDGQAPPRSPPHQTKILQSRKKGAWGDLEGKWGDTGGNRGKWRKTGALVLVLVLESCWGGLSSR